MTKHLLDGDKLREYLGPDADFTKYKQGVPTAVVAHQRIRDALKAGEFDVDPIAGTEQFADILNAEQIDSSYQKADASRGDRAYLCYEVFDLINSHNNLLAEVERLQLSLSIANKKVQVQQRLIDNTEAYKDVLCEAYEREIVFFRGENAALLEGLQTQLRITADGSAPDGWDGTTGGSGHADENQ